MEKITRREFMKAAGATGLTSVFALSTGLVGTIGAEEEKKKATPTKIPVEKPKMPHRTFGKTGVSVPILCLGGIIDFTSNQILLKKALDWDVTYWDTANSYNGGNSEEGIGRFFQKFPDARKKIFLVTKGGNRSPQGLEKMLNLSLERMKTDHIDLYFVHAVSNISQLTPEIKAWAEKAKKEKKIRFFGFSTHRNMAQNLLDASKLGWIDGIMTTYNYRLMQGDEMKKAVEACRKAGVGLTAMKTQGGGPVKTDNDAELRLAGRFINKGYTPHQAKIKAVWENPAIGSLCSQMPNLTILSANVAAAVDKTSLELSDLRELKTHDEKTCSGYCAGCADICERAMGGDTRIADVMRYLMYYHSYQDTGRAREDFCQLPPMVKRRMAALDYTPAEKACPRNLPIGNLMREAARILA